MDNQNINNPVPQEEDYLTFSKIWKYIKKSFFFSIICALIAVIIVLPIYLVKYKNSYDSVYQSLINYNYNGILENKTPDNSTFNKNEVKSEKVLTKAIEKAGVEIDAKTLSNHLTINEVFDEDTINLINSLEAKAKNDPKVLAQLQKINKATNTYQLVLIDSNNSLGLSSEQAQTLINCILDEYTISFNGKYYKQVAVDTIKDIAFDIEYMDIYNNFVTDMNNNIKVLNNLSEDFANYKSATSKNTFKDMAKNLELLKNLYIEPIYTTIIEGQVFNNSAHYKMTLTDILQHKTSEKESKEKTANSTNELIKQYQSAISKSANNTTIIFNEDTQRLYDLIKDKQQTDAEIEVLSQEIAFLQNLIAKIDTGAGAPTTEEKTAVTEKINLAKTEINKQLDVINKELDAFYESGYSQGAVSTKALPVKYVQTMSKKSVLMPTVLALIGGYAVGMIIFAIVNKVKNKKKNA